MACKTFAREAARFAQIKRSNNSIIVVFLCRTDLYALSIMQHIGFTNPTLIDCDSRRVYQRMETSSPTRATI